MATKTITTHVTLVTKDESKSVPFKYDARGVVIQGHNEAVYNLPGTRVTFDATEADGILARFGGQEVDPDTGAVIRTVPTPLSHTPRPDTNAGRSSNG